MWTVYDLILMDFNKFSQIVGDDQILSIEILLNKFLNFADVTSAGFMSSLVKCTKRFKYLITKNQVFFSFFFYQTKNLEQFKEFVLSRKIC